MSQTIFSWLGAISACLILVLSIIWAFAGLMEVVRHQWESFVWAQRRLAFHEVGKRVLCELYYFSRSPEAMLAVEAIGESLRDSDGWRPEHADELWQRKMKDYENSKAMKLEAARKLVAEADKA